MEGRTIYLKLECWNCVITAAIKTSSESAVEILVSSHEKNFHSFRQMVGGHTLEEMEIAENGLLLHNATHLLEKAMNKYWRGGE